MNMKEVFSRDEVPDDTKGILVSSKLEAFAIMEKYSEGWYIKIGMNRFLYVWKSEYDHNQETDA